VVPQLELQVESRPVRDVPRPSLRKVLAG
jgi:hypothetical protein